MRAFALVIVLAACGSTAAPRTLANVGPSAPTTVTCFAGTYTGFDGERVGIVMRRTVDPMTSSIRQESVRESAGSVLAGEVTLNVTGSTFLSKTPENARGEGRLDGPAWAWNHWTETRHHDGWTEDLEGWLEGERLRFRGRHVEKRTTWAAELDVFDCSEYDGRIAAWEHVAQ